MRTVMRTMLVVANVLLLAAGARAQAAADPAGHWEGTLVIPNGELPFAIDLTRVDGRALSGTITLSTQQINGLPLTSVSLDGATLTFTIVGNGGGVFKGAVTDASIAGEFVSSQGSTTFALKRTGAARVTAPLTGLAISKDMEGTWMGTLQANGRGMRIQLTMSNGADGTSTAKATSLDEGGLELPVAITDTSSATFSFNIPILATAFTGVVNEAHTEIAGTYKQNGLALPLTFTRPGQGRP